MKDKRFKASARKEMHKQDVLEKKEGHSKEFLAKHAEWDNQPGNRASRREEAKQERHKSSIAIKERKEGLVLSKIKSDKLKRENIIKKADARREEINATGKKKIKLTKKRLKRAAKNERILDKKRKKRAAYRAKKNNIK